MTTMTKITMAAVLLAACGSGSESEIGERGEVQVQAPSAGGEATQAAAGPTVEELTALAAEAWVYGYPAVYQRDEMVRATSPDNGLAFGAPLNLTGSATQLATPTDRFVSINNDSMYHMVQADVGAEPLVLNVPATGDRYVVLQFVDAWTNNFAYIGTRGTGGRAGRYLLAGPDWQGEAAEGLTLVRCPTRMFTIVGRVAVDGERDIGAARRVQESIWVTPLSVYPEQVDRAERALGDRDFAPYDTEVPEELVFWEKLRSWMALNPPPEAEADIIARYEALGLLVAGAESPYRDPSPELRQALVAGLEASTAQLEETLRAGAGTTGETGWSVSLHVFDYNLDYFEVGTIDSDEWKFSDRSAAFTMRALAARGGLWGNHAYEAAYANTYVDADGEQLDGANRYELTFETLPPVDAFWSVTMYDHPNYWLVDNAANRYSIGDRTRGLRRARDGSVTIYISREPPPRAQRANWLPAPEGPFRPILRMYLPQDAILDGTWTIPAIRRVDAD